MPGPVHPERETRSHKDNGCRDQKRGAANEEQIKANFRISGKTSLKDQMYIPRLNGSFPGNGMGLLSSVRA